MIEILAAVTGASLSWAAMGSMGRSSRAQSQQEAVVRLTSAVEHIATQLEVMHLDLREERKEFYGRLNSVEQRVSLSWKHNRASRHGVPVSPCFLDRTGCYQRGNRPVAVEVQQRRPTGTASTVCT
jgi:hypothetical protein